MGTSNFFNLFLADTLHSASALAGVKGRFFKGGQWLMVNASSRRRGIPGGKHHVKSIINIMLNLMLSHALSMLYLCSIHAPPVIPRPLSRVRFPAHSPPMLRL